MTQPNIPPHKSGALQSDTPEQKPQDVVTTERVPLAMTFDELLGADDSDDETTDDMIRAVREMRDTPSNRSLD